jgi:putative addiction module killer protein
MYTFIRSSDFDVWLAGLKDNMGKARILHRIRSAELGNFGDCAPVGNGVSEMRVHAGPGYRLYFAKRGALVYWLLLGGDKSTQQRDIKHSKQILKVLDKEYGP